MSRLLRFHKDMRVVRTLLRSALVIKKYAPEKPVSYSDVLAPFVERDGDRPALIGESGSMTWRELDAYANRVAHWAKSEGLGHGDVVALSMENRPEFIAIWLGSAPGFRMRSYRAVLPSM